MIDKCSILRGKRRERGCIIKILSVNTTAKPCTLARQKFNVAYPASVI
jgi:hypothetical protein